MGAAQIESTLGDVDANLRKHLNAIDAARAAGVDFLLFPELSLVGHNAGREAARLAIDRDHSAVAAIARASRGMVTMFGAIERAGPNFYNSTFAVRHRLVLAVHRKINLATYGKLDDGLHYVPGSRVDTFDVMTDSTLGTPVNASLDSPVVVPADVTTTRVSPWRIAPMICADTWNPPLVHLAAAQGAMLMAVAASSALEAVGDPFDNPSGWDVNLRFHALTYGMAVVMANRVGHEDGLTFWGGSRIVDPHGRTLVVAGDSETLIHASIDRREVDHARRLLPTIRDANHTLLSAEFERIGRLRGDGWLRD